MINIQRMELLCQTLYKGFPQLQNIILKDTYLSPVFISDLQKSVLFGCPNLISIILQSISGVINRWYIRFI